jgi:hypothetical protein
MVYELLQVGKRHIIVCIIVACLAVQIHFLICIGVSAQTLDIESTNDNIRQPEQIPVSYSNLEHDNYLDAERNINDAVDNHNNSSTEIGVWLYTNRYLNTIPKEIVDKLQAWKINTIYFAGTDVEDWNNQSSRRIYTDFIRYASEQGINVYAVTLEDPYFALKKPQELEDSFRRFINLTSDLFDTYVVDVEPHAILGPDVHTFIPEYIRMSHILGHVAKGENVRYIDTVPYWYHTVIRQMGLSPGLDILASDGVNLMTYTYTSNQTLENIKKIQSDINKPVTVSIKITPGQNAPHLKSNELSKIIDQFISQKLDFTIYEAQYILSR